jgi:hypothetical protein
MHYYAKLKTDADLSAADNYTDLFDTRYSRHNRFQVEGATTGTPVAVLKVQVTEEVEKARADVANGVYGSSDTAQWTEVEIPEEAVHGLGSGQAWSAGTVTWDGTAALNIWIDLQDVGAACRLWYDRTSGGAANASYQVRGGGFEE